MSIELERKLEASSVPDALKKEILDKLDWYRTNYMLVTRERNELKQQVSDEGWRTNPDRMGGCYSEDELRQDNWK